MDNIVGGGRRGGVFTFATIFSLESLVRALNASVIPIQAYELLGSSRNVSVLTTTMALCVMATTLMLPLAFARLRRRWAYTFGISLSLAATLFLASYTIAGTFAGLYLRQAGASIMGVTLSLYILDHVSKLDYARVEPMRLAISTISWTVGPSLGVYLYANHGPWAPQVALMVACLVLLVTFWVFRLADPKTLPQGDMRGFNPLSNARSFFAQPRLRLAWSIAFMRSVFWAGTFTYGPLLFIEGGRTREFAGYVISATQLLLPCALFFGWLGRRQGVRPVIAGSFACIAIMSFGAGVSGVSMPMLTAVFLLAGAVGASGLDGVGSIPFMRAVKPRQRQRMTSVYRTFIEASEILPGFVFAIVLTLFPTQSVFFVIAVGSLAMAILSWKHLPKSL